MNSSSTQEGRGEPDEARDLFPSCSRARLEMQCSSPRMMPEDMARSVGSAFRPKETASIPSCLRSAAKTRCASSACVPRPIPKFEDMSSKAKRRGRLTRNTVAEEDRIRAAIKTDPDTRDLTAQDFAKMVPFPEMMRRRGRPKAAKHKVPVTLRLEPEVVEHFRRDGRGWQTRVNDALVRYVAKRQRDDD